MYVFIFNIKFLFNFAAQLNGTTPSPPLSHSYTMACKYSKYLCLCHVFCIVIKPLCSSC